MRTLVYKFSLRPPTEGAEILQRQFRLAHDYRNDLVAIERGRRNAIRALFERDDVRNAEELLRGSTRSTRKDAVSALFSLRRLILRETRCEGGRWAVSDEDTQIYAFSALYETERIELLYRRLCKDAYNLYGARGLAWGTRLTVSAAADAARRADLYEDDGLAAASPKFERWSSMGPDKSGVEWPDYGQIAVQIQGGLRVADAASDRRVRLTYRSIYAGTTRPQWRDEQLRLRVGSDGREPIWATWPCTMHRAIPDDARWKWVKVSCWLEAFRLRWSADITLEVDGAPPRTLDRERRGAIAIEATWDEPGDTLIVARWRDSDGQKGIFEMTPRMREAFVRVNGLRSVRDRILKGDKESRLPGMRATLARILREEKSEKPAWLASAAATMHLWESPRRFHDLFRKWQDDPHRGAGYEVLAAWVQRDIHLYQYETHARNNVLRHRLWWYRNLAARWVERYAHAITDDRKLHREARWGEASDRRFIASPAELRTSIRQAFGDECGEHTVSTAELSEEDDRDWCERAIDAWHAGGARKEKKGKGKRSNAWADRKQKKATRYAQNETARETVVKCAE